MFLSFGLGAILHYLGMESLALFFIGIAMVMSQVRDNNAAMLVAAAFAVPLVAVIAPKRPQGTLRRSVATSAAFVAAFAVVVATDWTYSVSPLNDLLPASKLWLSPSPKTELRLTVEDVRLLPDKLSGAIAEVEGVLEYSPSMRRFVLRSPDVRSNQIYAYFHRGTSSSFGERLDTSRAPRYFDQVQPFIGQRLRVIGKCLDGAIYVEISDIARVD